MPGNPLGTATSLIQFDDDSAMAALGQQPGGGRAQQKNDGYHRHLFLVESSTCSPRSNNSASWSKSLLPGPFPPPAAYWALGAQSNLTLQKSGLNTAP